MLMKIKTDVYITNTCMQMYAYRSMYVHIHISHYIATSQI